jgi:hypothetical protein
MAKLKKKIDEKLYVNFIINGYNNKLNRLQQMDVDFIVDKEEVNILNDDDNNYYSNIYNMYLD